MKPNKPIEDIDVDVIIMYLENKNKSNGGEILNHEYNKITNSLNVIYEAKTSKVGVLSKKVHKLLDYILVSSELVQSKNDLKKIEQLKTKLPNIIVLSNIDSNEDMSILTLYAEYLVPDNEIIEVKVSKFFKNSYMIEFKEEVNFEQVLKRYFKRTTLRNQSVKLYQAFETYTHFISNPLDFNLQLLNPNSYFAYIESMSVYVLVSQGDATVSNVLEKLYSFEQLEDLLPEDLLVDIKQEPIDDHLNDAPSAVDFHPPIPVTVQSTPIKVEPENLKFIEISIENPLFIALLNCKQISKDFAANLNKINAVLHQINEKTFKIEHNNAAIQTEEHNSWLQKVEYIIEHFEKFINFAQIKLTSQVVPKMVEECISMLNATKSDLHIYINNFFVIIIGYENSVKYSYNIINNAIQQSSAYPVPQQQQQQQQQKVPLQHQQALKPPQQIDIEPMITTLFSNCADLFIDIQTILKSENAKLGPSNTNIVQIFPGSNDSIWKNCVRDRFNQFIIQNVKLHKLQIPSSMTKGFLKLMDKLSTNVNKRRVHYFLDNSSFNIIGCHEEVNKMIVQLNQDLQSLDQQPANQPLAHDAAQSNNDALFSFQIEEPLFTSLLLECKGIFDDLSVRLKSSNAQLSSSGIQSLTVQQIKKDNVPQKKTEWLEKVKETLLKFYQVQVTIEKVNIKYFDINLINKFKSDVANAKTQNFVYKLNPDEVIFCGFKRSVNRIISYLTQSFSAPQKPAPEPVVKPLLPPPPPTMMPPPVTIPKEDCIDIDYFISQTLVKCPNLYSKFSQKLGGCNGMLVYNQVKEKVEIVKKNKGSKTNDKWPRLNRNILNTFKTKNLKVVDYNLHSIENFNEHLMIKLKADLATLRSSIKCRNEFMFFIDQKSLNLKIISDPSVHKEPVDYMKQFFVDSKGPVTQASKQQSSNAPSTSSRSSSVTSIKRNNVLAPLFVNSGTECNENKIVIDMSTQPKLSVLFQFKNLFLNEFVRAIENAYNVRCIVDESIKKPSKANVVIMHQQMAAAFAASNEWKVEIMGFVAKYFDRFKQVRLNISENIFNEISKSSVLQFAILKRLSRNSYEVIGLNEEVDGILTDIRRLESSK